MRKSSISKAALKRPRRCRHCFNMIEIALGLGLIVFGLISTVGLFPVGLTSNRDSIAESYAADSVDQLVHFLSGRLKDPTNDYANWSSFGQSLPTTKPGPTEPSGTWSEWFSEGTVAYWYGGSSREFYRVEQRAAGASMPDFAAVYRVWRETVTYTHENEDGTWSDLTLDSSEALGLQVEVSWPGHLSYEHRQKALYHLEVHRPQS